MRIFLKAVIWIIVLLFIVAGGFLIYVNLFLPDVSEAPDIKIEATPERLERGEYLANHLMVCMSCHSPRDWTQYAAPVVKAQLGAGGTVFGHEKGLPGEFYPANLTPYHLGDWSDGEILQALSAGVNKEGKPLFPIMPYHSYSKLSKDYLYAVIAYLRTLPPIESEERTSEADFPVNIIMNFMPSDPAFSERPDPSDQVAYGKYLVTAAACADCHTPLEEGKPVDSLRFAGGMSFHLKSGGYATSANITPDRETGIGSWTEKAFVDKFRSFMDPEYDDETIIPGSINTEMPWREYAALKEADLKAMYAYLRTLKPIKNRIIKFKPE
ncbi:MAG: c-type cytochrome [Bacteroidota bacterium]|nr:c-type cytochrome [Bacteroidota bacterium]